MDIDGEPTIVDFVDLVKSYKDIKFEFVGMYADEMERILRAE